MSPYVIAYTPLVLLVAAFGLRMAYEFRVGVAPAAHAKTDATSRVGSGMGRRAWTPAAHPPTFDVTIELEAIEFEWPKRPTGPYGEEEN